MVNYTALIGNLLEIIKNCSATDTDPTKSFVLYVKKTSGLQHAIFVATRCLAGHDDSPAGQVYVHDIVISYIMVLVSMSDFIEYEDFNLFDRLRNHGADTICLADIFKYAIEPYSNSGLKEAEFRADLGDGMYEFTKKHAAWGFQEAISAAYEDTHTHAVQLSTIVQHARIIWNECCSDTAHLQSICECEKMAWGMMLGFFSGSRGTAAASGTPFMFKLRERKSMKRFLAYMDTDSLGKLVLNGVITPAVLQVEFTGGDDEDEGPFISGGGINSSTNPPPPP